MFCLLIIIRKLEFIQTATNGFSEFPIKMPRICMGIATLCVCDSEEKRSRCVCVNICQTNYLQCALKIKLIGH